MESRRNGPQLSSRHDDDDDSKQVTTECSSYGLCIVSSAADILLSFYYQVPKGLVNGLSGISIQRNARNAPNAMNATHVRNASSSQ